LERALNIWNKKEKGTKLGNNELSSIAWKRNLKRALKCWNKKEKGTKKDNKELS
jgi:hypothetical protein